MCLPISCFIASCSTYQHIKDSMQYTPDFLQPLPIPSHCFESWSLDFITNLPLSHGCNIVLTCVDRLAICVGSPLVSWVAPSLVWENWPAIFSIQSSNTIACLHWWYMTEIIGLKVHLGRPFCLTWEPNASLVPAIIHRPMAKPSVTTVVSNKY